MDTPSFVSGREIMLWRLLRSISCRSSGSNVLVPLALPQFTLQPVLNRNRPSSSSHVIKRLLKLPLSRIYSWRRLVCNLPVQIFQLSLYLNSLLFQTNQSICFQSLQESARGPCSLELQIIPRVIRIMIIP